MCPSMLTACLLLSLHNPQSLPAYFNIDAFGRQTAKINNLYQIVYNLSKSFLRCENFTAMGLHSVNEIKGWGFVKVWKDMHRDGS